MHKNALFLLKIAKIAQRWGFAHRPQPPASAGSAPRTRQAPSPLTNPGYTTDYYHHITDYLTKLNIIEHFSC